jgi:hypothetical protein
MSQSIAKQNCACDRLMSGYWPVIARGSPEPESSRFIWLIGPHGAEQPIDRSAANADR